MSDFSEIYDAHVRQQSEDRLAATLVQQLARWERLRAVARGISKTMRCNCDLDNWEPEKETGHSWVCRIHKATLEDASANAPTPILAEVSE